MGLDLTGKMLAGLLKEIPHMTVIASEAAGAEMPREYPRRAAVVSWIFFDWAAQPYFTLITTFVFAPYFASFVALDPAQGQALWGFATAAAGLMIALLSPVLGAIADASGRRKPWIAGFGALLVIGASLMWFGKPGDPSVIPPLLLAYAIASVGVEFATVFNNAMMPTLVPPKKWGGCPAPAGPPAISAASSASSWCSAFWPPTPIRGVRFSAWHRCSASIRSATRATASPAR
jgi:Na+/melibiose symporter-like transporter